MRVPVGHRFGMEWICILTGKKKSHSMIPVLAVARFYGMIKDKSVHPKRIFSFSPMLATGCFKVWLF